jgi:excisionase family DNA binding protein
MERKKLNREMPNDNPQTNQKPDIRPERANTEPISTSVKGAATMLAVSTYSVYELLKSNRLPHARIGRSIGFRLMAVKAFVQRSETVR